MKFISLSQGCSGHAAQFIVQAEIVLKGDGRQSDIFGLDGASFLGFNGLMQPIGEAATRHHSAGKLVNQHNFIVPHDVVFIANKELMRPQPLVNMVHNRGAFRIIKRLTVW